MTETKKDLAKKHDLRDDVGPGVAIDTEDEHSVLDREKIPSNEEDVTRPWPSHSTVPEGQTNKGGV